MSPSPIDFFHLRSDQLGPRGAKDTPAEGSPVSRPRKRLSLSAGEFAKRGRQIIVDLTNAIDDYERLSVIGHHRGVHGESGGGGSGFGSATESALVASESVRDSLSDASTELAIAESKAAAVKSALSRGWGFVDKEIPQRIEPSYDRLRERNTELDEQIDVLERKLRRMKADRAKRLKAEQVAAEKERRAADAGVTLKRRSGWVKA